MNLEFRTARHADVNRIAHGMAAMDVLECAAFGHTPKQALRQGLALSIASWTALVDGRPEAMFGLAVTSWATGRGSPWFLCTERSRAHPRPFLARAPAFVEWMAAWCPHLENQVHRDNLRAIRWLERLGFAVSPETVDIGGQPMRQFSRGASECVIRPGVFSPPP